jgi:LDH2 family malate/lactate/ureidoglycolate dehydrogenase
MGVTSNKHLVGVSELQYLVADILCGHGTPSQHATAVSQHLVSANLSGVDSHGVRLLPVYIRAIESGELDPAARPEIVSDNGAVARIRGHWGFGQLGALEATRLAVAKASEFGLGAVALVEAHHIGRLGEYAEQAAAVQVVLVIWGGGQGVEEPKAVPYGGAIPVLHTNPVAIGFPTAWGAPFLLDMATSTVSGAKIAQARSRGERLPRGAIVDKAGQPSTDPNDFLNGGAHVAFGGHKGYGLMLAAELLGRVLTGSEEYSSTNGGGPVFRHSGNLFIALKPSAFADGALASTEAALLLDRLRNTPPAPGFREVMVPGDPENRARETRTNAGIPLDEDVWQSLQELQAALPHAGDDFRLQPY